jgi:hypothetical protein
MLPAEAAEARQRSKQAHERVNQRIEEAGARVPEGRKHAIGQKVAAMSKALAAWRRGLQAEIEAEEIQAILGEGGFAKGFVDSMQKRIQRIQSQGTEVAVKGLG